jgi:hypothetical protein
MPAESQGPTAASTPTAATYVWESVERPGDYALCTDPQHRDFQNPNWRFRGELATVPELDGFPRPTITRGWPMRVRKDPSRDDGIGG